MGWGSSSAPGHQARHADSQAAQGKQTLPTKAAGQSPRSMPTRQMGVRRHFSDGTSLSTVGWCWRLIVDFGGLRTWWVWWWWGGGLAQGLGI